MTDDFVTGGAHFKRALGQTFTRIRRAHQVRQGSVARRAGLTQPQWSRVERGQSGLGLEEFLRACDELDVDPRAVLESILHVHHARGGATRARGDGREVATIVSQTLADRRVISVVPLTRATAAAALARLARVRGSRERRRARRAAS